VIKYPFDTTQQVLYDIVPSPDDNGYLMAGTVYNWGFSDDNGSYLWIVSTDSIGCGPMPSCAFGIWEYFELENPYVSIEDIPISSNKIHAYPNPTDGLLYLDHQLHNVKQILLVDESGRILKQMPDMPFIDLSNLKSGLYIYYIHTEDKIYTGKVIRI